MMPACVSFVLAAGAETSVVLDLIIVLGASAFAVLALARIGVAAIPALILTGALIGPHALGLVPAPDALGVIAHLAIIFLLFGVGLELHLDALRPGAARLLIAAVGACVGCTLLLWPVANAFTGSAPQGLVIAMAFALSSTAVVLKYFAGRRELTQPAGRLGLAILVVQDLAVIGMLAMVPLLARWAGTDALGVAESGAFDSVPDVLLRVGGVAALIVVGRKGLPWLLRESLRAGGTEALFITGMAFALGAAGACEALGFSLELGAFLAGFILADTPFRQELSGQVVPVRDLFLAIFFTTLGMNVDPAAALAVWPWVLAGLGILLVGKGLVTGLACWIAGTHASTALVVGACLAHGGEFSLVLLDQADAAGLVDPQLHSVLIVLVVVSLLVMPALGALARRLAPRLEAAPTAPFTGTSRLTVPYGCIPEDGSAPLVVLVVGYGPVGRQAGGAIKDAGLVPVVIDLNPKTVSTLQRDGEAAVLGDARTESVLRAAGIERALGLVLTVPDVAVARGAAAAARRLRPDLWIAARSPLAVGGAKLSEAGADLVLSDEDSVGERLADAVGTGLAAILEARRRPEDVEVEG